MALKVIEILYLNMVPIYTVHENFITTPYCCNDVTTAYIYTLFEWDSPLKIINDFILLNLIPQNAPLTFNKEEFFPLDELRSLLEDFLNFKDLREKERKKLTSKIDELVCCYETYLVEISGGCIGEDINTPDINQYHIVYNRFKDALLQWRNLENKYCLHYEYDYIQQSKDIYRQKRNTYQ